ncbi:TPA: hypothetical protein DEG75_02455 [Candidatus Dependentiae bacterium]|nr:hypothetical protein [Candidatus Dependentiae bacterium]
MPIGFAFSKGFDRLLNKGFDYPNPLLGMGFLNRQDLLFNLIVLGKGEGDFIKKTASGHPLVSLAKILFFRPPTQNIHVAFKAAGWVAKTFTCEELGWLCALLAQSESVDEEELHSAIEAFGARGKNFSELSTKYEDANKKKNKNLKMLANLKKQLEEVDLTPLEKTWFDFVVGVRAHAKDFSYDRFAYVMKLLVTASQQARDNQNKVQIYDVNIPFYLLSAVAVAKAQSKLDLLSFVEGFAKHFDSVLATVLSPQGLAVVNNVKDARQVFLSEKYSKDDNDALYGKTFINPTDADLLYGILNMREKPRTVTFEGGGDCTEAGVLYLADTYLFNSDLEAYDFSILSPSIKDKQEVKDFAKKFIDGLNNSDGREWWYYQFSDKAHQKNKSNFVYVQTDKQCELNALPENIYKALALFFGVTATNFKELGEKLSHGDLTVRFEVTEQDPQHTDIRMTVETKDKKVARNATLKINHGVHTEVVGGVSTKVSPSVFLDQYNKKVSEWPFSLFVAWGNSWTKNDIRSLLMQALDGSDGFSELCYLYGSSDALAAQKDFEELIKLEAIKPHDVLLRGEIWHIIAQNPHKVPLKNYVELVPASRLIRDIGDEDLPVLIKNMGGEWAKKNAYDLVLVSADKLHNEWNTQYFTNLNNALIQVNLSYAEVYNVALDETLKKVASSEKYEQEWAERCFDWLVTINELIEKGVYTGVDTTKLMNPLVQLIDAWKNKKVSPEECKRLFDEIFGPGFLKKNTELLLHSVGEVYLIDLLASAKQQGLDVSSVLPVVLDITFITVSEGEKRQDNKDALEEFIRLFPEAVGVKARQEMINKSPDMLPIIVKLEKKMTTADESILLVALDALLSEKNIEVARALSNAFRKIASVLLVKDTIADKKTFVDLLGEKQNAIESLDLDVRANLAKALMQAVLYICWPDAPNGVLDGSQKDALGRSIVDVVMQKCPWVLTDEVKEKLFAAGPSDFVEYGIFFDELLRQARGWTFGTNKSHHAFYVIVKSIFDFGTRLKNASENKDTTTLKKLDVRGGGAGWAGSAKGSLKDFLELVKDVKIDSDKDAKEIVEDFAQAFGGKKMAVTVRKPLSDTYYDLWEFLIDLIELMEDFGIEK